ncbi:hypothetical protein JZM24_15065 [Candidatus Sodalis endolongispinus]|uniref:MATE family efflux transporter n=1 Tax=Candidatus Sodalis endolongispinus TaxID=2812662 RepID=A0ABS5YDM6_9GAMM|nr:MATE family efflux transporter [Candidatus Sodalis endolongispinus]MBT9433111.1 hypothetical protein [Candidatus Sodalis endolongispinus]
MARAAPDGETRVLLAIAAPLAVAQIGQMAMMLTASMVLWRLDSVALAGAWLLSLLVSLPLILLLTHITPLLRLFGVTADVAGYAGQFCRAYAWGIPAMLCSAPLRYYLASLERTRIVMWVAFIVSGVHFPLSWLWVLGAGDARGHGIAGAGYALSLCWWLMLVGLALYSARQRMLPPGMLRLPARELRTAVGALLRIGWPIGGLYAAEMGLISFSSLLAGQFGAVSLGAHMVCMNVANIIFMVPLSLG